MANGPVKIDEYDYFDLATKKRADGDLVGSLTVLRNIEDSGTKNLEVYAMMGEIFFDMEIYSASQEYWFRYLAGSNRQDVRLKAYSALGATFCMTMDNYLMGYYYDLEFALNPQAEQEYDHILFDYLDYNKEEFPEFYVTYPTENLSSKNLFVSALDLVEKGELSAAISRFSMVKPNSEEFDDAVYRAAVCMKETGVNDEGILEFLYKKFEEAENKGKVALSICEMLADGDKEKIKYYLDAAFESDLDEPGDWYYVARRYAELGDTDKCERALDNSLDINPYEIRSIYLYGVILYNRGLIQDSRLYFKTGYDISRDQVNLFYYRLTFDENAKKLYPTLPYSYSLPQKEAARRITEIALLVAGSKNKLKKTDADELIALASYGLTFSNNLAGDMIKAFIEYGPTKVRKFFIYKLLSQVVRNIDKMNIVEALTLIGYDKKVDVVFDNIYLKVRLFKATFDGDNARTFESAYALAVSRTFPFLKDLSYLRDSAYSVYYTLEKRGKVKKVKSVGALAAVIIKLSSTKQPEEEMLERFFKASKEEIKEITDLIND